MATGDLDVTVVVAGSGARPATRLWRALTPGAPGTLAFSLVYTFSLVFGRALIGLPLVRGVMADLRRPHLQVGSARHGASVSARS